VEVEISEDMQVVHFDFNRSEFLITAYFGLSCLNPRRYRVSQVIGWSSNLILKKLYQVLQSQLRTMAFVQMVEIVY
jgi:hypothetical protein